MGSYSKQRQAENDFLKRHGYGDAQKLLGRLRNRTDTCLVSHDGQKINLHLKGKEPRFVTGDEPAVLGWYNGECKPKHLHEDLLWHAITIRGYKLTETN